MSEFFNKEDYSPEDIYALISIGAEESTYLEFKASGSLATSDGKKNEIAKDISAFANSDGGILIYGIEEANHIAASFSFIDGNTFTKEWLENIIQSRITPRLSQFRIIPVRIDNDFQKTVYVVKIQRSDISPHMTADKRFFKRYNFRSAQMEEYEIRDLYNRKNKTSLEIEDILISDRGASRSAQRLTEARYQIAFQVRNAGGMIEDKCKLEVIIPFVLLATNNPSNGYKIRHEDDMAVFSVPNTSPIFQHETTTLATFYLNFHHHTLAHLNTPIKAKLYFSSGIQGRIFEFRGRLFQDDELIENQF